MDSEFVSTLQEKANHLVQDIWLSSATCLLIASGWYYYRTKYNYWPQRGVKGDQPWPLIGDMYTLATKNRFSVDRERVKKYGKVYGCFSIGSPALVIADAEVLRQICIKDFDAFPNHEPKALANKYQHHQLVRLEGDYWKKVRSMMSPTFTSGKIKRMFRLLDGCADDLVAYISEQFKESVANDGLIVDILNLYSMFTMDGITTCCYGLKLQRERESNNNNQLKATGMSRNEFVKIMLKKSHISLFRVFLISTVPTFVMKLIGFKMNSEKSYEPLAERLSKLIDSRRSSTKKYDDLLQLLVDAKMGDKLELNQMDQAENHHASLSQESLIKDQEKLIEDVAKSNQVEAKHVEFTDMEILSEAILFLSAGLETTSILLSNCTYSLAFHPDVQERLYQVLLKITKFSSEKDRHLFEYDALTSCQYLDSVISETLRTLPPAAQADRVATRDYVIEKYNVRMMKGDKLRLGISAVQNDPDYWEEPTKFNPDRFMPDNKENIVPGSYMPFGIGPRHCIGMRFSLTEAKLGLAKVMMRYKFEPAPNTKYPPMPNSVQSLTALVNPIIKIVPRDSKLY